MDSEKLIKKLINNEITREEFEALLEHLDDDQLRAKYDDYLYSEFMNEVNIHFKKIERKETPKPSKSKKSGSDHKRYYSIAAMLLVVVSVAFYILLLMPEYGETISNERVGTADDIQLEIKNTPTKRMFRTRLADGSFVHLNAVSSISYPKIFAPDKREVKVSGEAYFDISRDVDRPFLINIKDHKIEVLGTSFNIRAYEEDDAFSVVVESGSVKVVLDKEKNESIILTKNQKIIFSESKGKFEVTEVNPEDELSWRKGILRFDSTPFKEVEKMLERWYGVDVLIQDSSIYQKSITGIHQNENIRSVLESVTYVTGTQYAIRNNTIIIKK